MKIAQFSKKKPKLAFAKLSILKIAIFENFENFQF
jgi:hypothetical protein